MDRIVTLKGARKGRGKREMRRWFWVWAVLAGCLASVPVVLAQAPAGEDSGAQGQTNPAVPKPAAPKPAAPQTGSNPFPEDTHSIPVLTAKPDAGMDERNNGAAFGRTALPDEDLDPVRSPDDAVAAPSAMDRGSSSSLAGLDKLLPGPDDDEKDKDQKGKDTRRKLTVKEPTHKEAASKDIEVGGYYLETKNWKAAESRFESAMVLDPDNPDVFWGLAEAERHLGNFADARTHYQTVLIYDPDSKHGKDARKALKDPEIANAKAVAATPAK
jgi:hypothetical protein